MQLHFWARHYSFDLLKWGVVARWLECATDDRRVPVSRFECVSGLSVYPVEIRSVNNLSSSEDCSTDYCQPV